MEKAFNEIGGMVRSGSPVKLALNCSAKVLHLRRLPDILTASLSAYNFDPQWFELEITEASIMKKFKQSLDVIFRLKETGISISLDDFGTGYSSLARLKNLPVDSIKIDRSFIGEAGGKGNDAHIIEAVVSLSQKFGVKVIAGCADLCALYRGHIYKRHMASLLPRKSGYGYGCAPRIYCSRR